MSAPTSDGRHDDRRLAKYVRRTVFPHSAYYQARANGARDLASVAPTDLAELDDPSALVLRPRFATMVREGSRWLAFRALVSRASGGFHQFNHRVIEDQFKPVHWVVSRGVPLGYSVSDLQRLARRGEQWLRRAGVGRSDVVLSVLSPGPSVAHWQLVLGCRRARISTMHLEPAMDPLWLERLAPSVIAGQPDELVALLEASRRAGHRLANLRTVLAVGDPLEPSVREQLRGLAPDAVVVGAWAPAGVRAIWSECRPSAETGGQAGYHAWDDDVLEVGDDGTLLWTGLGWHGSALVRLRTHVAATVQRTPCPSCGRRVARVVPTTATVDRILAGDAEVAEWFVEHRRGPDGQPERIVTIAPAWGVAPVPLVRRLDSRLHATQFVVLGREEVADRIAAAGGQRVVDETEP